MSGWLVLSMAFPNSKFSYFIMFGVLSCIHATLTKPNPYLSGLGHWFIYNDLRNNKV